MKPPWSGVFPVPDTVRMRARDSVWIHLAFGIALLWAAVAVIAVLGTFALTAHDDLVEAREGSTPVAASPTAEPSRPGDIPGEAVLVTEDTVLGTVEAPEEGGADPPHVLYWLTCDDGLLTIATTAETVYAETDCSRYWLVHEVVRPYQGKPVRIAVTVGTPSTLVMEAAGAGAARFEVDGVWVVRR